MARKSKIERAKYPAKFKVRVRNRCKMCGRSRGYLRDFGLCRICFRFLANSGKILEL